MFCLLSTVLDLQPHTFWHVAYIWSAIQTFQAGIFGQRAKVERKMGQNSGGMGQGSKLLSFMIHRKWVNIFNLVRGKTVLGFSFAKDEQFIKIFLVAWFVSFRCLL